MTFGDKVAKLRKENNYTQEQLAALLGVSRQSVGKWESDTAFPETEKLIRLSELFGCTTDWLLKDEPESGGNQAVPPALSMRIHFQERKSRKTLAGIPLWHIGKNAKGIVAVGLNARGVIAVGLWAQGIFSFGLASVGVFSFGLLSIGILAVGLLALGAFSAGCFAAGLLAAGAVSLGIVSVGAVAVGDFAAGALAIGEYAAVGDRARGMIALGSTEAMGSLFQHCSNRAVSPEQLRECRRLLYDCTPNWLEWAKALFQYFFL